jgi:threonine/homoserine/homoserine lactone efflux protein
VLFIVARSGAQGRRAGLVSVLGVHTASIVHVLAAVAGVSAVVVASSLAFTAVKVVGGCYLIFLGLKSLRSARTASAASAPEIRATKQLFAEGFLVSLLETPKVALFNRLACTPHARVSVERGRGTRCARMLSQTLLQRGTAVRSRSACAPDQGM